MIRDLALRIFEGFSIERWNDLVRPFELIEMDKAAEKMVLAYIIGKYEENRGNTIDWGWMIYASLFDLLKKIALCDIKSPVQSLIKKEFPSEYMRLNEWVLNQYRSVISDDDLASPAIRVIDDSLKDALYEVGVCAAAFIPLTVYLDEYHIIVSDESGWSLCLIFFRTEIERLTMLIH